MTGKELIKYWNQEADKLDEKADGASTFASCLLSGEAFGLRRAAKDLEELLKDAYND